MCITMCIHNNVLKSVLKYVWSKYVTVDIVMEKRNTNT